MSLNTAADIATIAGFVLAVILASGGSFLVIGYIFKMRPIWKRFTDNVGRQLAVVSTEKQSMDHEADLLENIGYFKKVKRFTADIRNVNLLRGSALIVVGYSPNSKIYKAALKYATDNSLPIIVFSGDHRLTPDDLTQLKKYSFSSLCETELRLISDVFAVMTTFPEANP